MRLASRAPGRTTQDRVLDYTYIKLLLVSLAARAFSVPTWSTNSGVGPKVSGQASAVDASGRVLLFGGLTGSAGSPATDELWAYEDSQWSQLTTEGGPGPRMYAAAAALGDSLYVLGGWDPGAPGSGGSFKDEAWKLDLGSMRWSRLAKPMPCGAVSRHTACTVGERIVVHTFRSTVVVEADGSMREQPTTGEAPDGLSMCAAAPLGDEAMLVFGGSTKTQGFSGDVYVLDTRSWRWRKLRPAGGDGVAPSPRGSACAAAVDEATCVVFGGAGVGKRGYDGGKGLVAFDETWRLRVDGDDAVWELLLAEATDGGREADDTPSARVAASLSPLPDGGGLLLHGGWMPATKETFDVSYILDL